MKKSIFTIIAALAFFSAANAQFYGGVATGRGGQVSIFGGIASTIAKPLFQYNTTYYDPYYNYTYTDWNNVSADKVSAQMGPTFIISMSSMKDNSEQFSIGAMLGVGYTRCQWKADFSAATLGSVNDYSLWSKSNLIDLQLGVAGAYKIAESISIDFAVGPHILFVAGNQARVEKYLNGTLIPETSNEWHEAGKVDNMSAPNIDIGGFARVGANYHFTETMWAGLAFQYRLPFFNISSAIQDDYSKDGYRYANEKLIYSDVEHSGWSLMLSLGIDFE